MKPNPKISIVLPVYNGRKYIRESIDSILGQSFTDWELIAVDDGSADGTAEILSEYVSRDDRISVIYNPVNQKLPKSLNIGFSRAKGGYLTWTSDDNRYLPDALETMAEYLDKNTDAAIVRSDYYFINESGERFGESNGYSDFDMYRWNCFGACFLYRRKVLETVGGYNPDAFGVEDYDYWLRILERFGTIHSIGKKLYEYRRHDGSLSATKRDMVLRGLSGLRERHQKKIFHMMKEHKEELCRMYYELLPAGGLSETFRNQLRSAVPELNGDLGFTSRRPFIVFGAGIYGGLAEKILGGLAVCFADNDRTKAGKTKCGKKILSFEEAGALSDRYDFFIAIEEKFLYEIIRQLYENGITEYTTMQSYMQGYEKNKGRTPHE